MAIPTEKPSYGPLDGVKVVYAAVELACPKAADLMADWGADVTWLENTGAGDTIRDTAYIKQAERRNQRSVALNYFSEEGREIFLNMIRDADIFMEASKGGTWARKGLTDEVLWAVNPKLVIVHVSGFGQTGDPKMVKRAAYDLTVMAYAGIIMQNGTEEQPMLPGPYAGDYFNTLMIASSALAALYKAEKSGKGESIDLAMYETLLAIGQYYLVDYLNEGIKWPRPGARNQNLCGIGEFKCKDGFLGVCLYGVDQNKYFLETIGLGHLWGTEDIPEDTSGLWLSNPHADEIQKAFEEYCLANSKYDIEEDFAAHRIAAQVVNDMEDLVEEEHLKLRNTWVDWETVDGETFHGLGVFPKFKNNPGQIWRPMPHQGGDTVDVLGPLGRGFNLKEDANYILVGGGLGVPPLIYAAQKLAEHDASFATAVFGYRNDHFAEEYVSRYADWSWSIDDAEGNVVDLLNKLEQGDDLKAYDRKPIILSCGPLPMMKAVADWAAERGIPAQLSMEQRMGCGYGTCVLCTIDTVDGRLKVCSDGPVFTREQLGWGK